jgi:ubiquinol-cytochrome c reductase cytochrome c subunit
MRLRRIFPIILIGLGIGLAFLLAPNAPTASAKDDVHGAEEGAGHDAKQSDRDPADFEPVGSGHDNVYTGDGQRLPDTDNPGLQLYTQHCSSCHGENGEGGEQGPPLGGVGAAAVDFYISSGRMPLRVAVDQAPRGRSLFSEEQRKAIVDYVANGFGKGGPEIPHVDMEKGNLVEGAELYANNCAMCHNSAGSGGALNGDYYAPQLYESTPTEVAEAIRFGPGAMPIFGEKTFTDEEVDSLVLYVNDLQSSEHPGGLPIGRYGPVAEGFVAWVIGLGGLLAFSRWLGTRT